MVSFDINSVYWYLLHELCKDIMQIGSDGDSDLYKSTLLALNKIINMQNDYQSSKVNIASSNNVYDM